MADSREALRRRFQPLHRVRTTRRVDFKGYRMRLNLRIPEAMSINLQIIKLVTGEAKNGFCERVLVEAVADSIRELKRQHGEEAWSAIETCAKRGKSPEPSR
ncbi:hypothetical protein [Hyphomicrobium sp.]|uniref:hypothetical protein n=1 Tax=Hyphomicrobium sp. TaxID=82 RepID=UPI002E32509D|nr:hypothetical protein [Hyphomicrobium sp.]HEX2842057.1 hypothetical protein [Hyphomicrobium sp.]